MNAVASVFQRYFQLNRLQSSSIGLESRQPSSFSSTQSAGKSTPLIDGPGDTVGTMGTFLTGDKVGGLVGDCGISTG
jgi:hypothetical protein